MDIVKKSLFKSLFLTALAVSLGVLVGLQMDDIRQNHLAEELRQSQLDSETFTVLESYSQYSDDNHCDIMDVQIPEMGERSGQLGSRLERFESQNIADDEEYRYIRNKYYNNQLRLYTSMLRYQAECETNQTMILYFFDDSTASARQGSVLNEIVDEDNGVQVFSFNLEVDNSLVVDMLKKDYNVTEAPSLVINDEKKLETYTSLGKLRAETR